MARKGGPPIILVIEDYSDSCTLLSSLLRARGYKVVEARDGQVRGRVERRIRAAPTRIASDVDAKRPFWQVYAVQASKLCGQLWAVAVDMARPA